MRNASFLKRLGASMANVACVSMIALLLGACASENKQQISPLANETGQGSVKNESGNGETADDQEIVCRMKKTTGTRFTHKVCATKAQWARLEEKNREKTDEFAKEVDTGSRTALPSSSDGMGGQSSGMPR